MNFQIKITVEDRNGIQKFNQLVWLHSMYFPKTLCRFKVE